MSTPTSGAQPVRIPVARWAEEDDLPGWPTGAFRAILADPPWSGGTPPGQRGLRGQGWHYKTQSDEWIRGLPVADLADRDCVLFLWCIFPSLPAALLVMRDWGFEYKTCGFCWAKTRGAAFKPHMGMGQWTRSNTELCLLGTRGRPERMRGDVPQLIMAPLREHSRKPDVTHERIERLVDGPYLELFARTRRPGWTTWGNDLDRFSVQSPLWDDPPCW